MDTYTPITIISAERREHSDELNHELTIVLREELQHGGYAFLEGTGSYEGHREHSFIVVTPEPTDLLEQGRRFSQDALLYRGTDGLCLLVDCLNGSLQPTGGLLTPVTAEEAAQASGYTEVSGRYYIVA